MKRLLPFFLFLFVVCESYAQHVSCSQTLRLAQSTYEQGRLHEVPSLLQGCLTSGFNKQEKVSAYKLLTLSYLYLEEPEKADEAMLNLLRTDPYFEINPAVDPAEFVGLYKSFRTKPIYRVGVVMGVNATRPNVTSSVETAANSESEYTYGLAFQVGANVEIPFNEKITFNPSLLFQQKGFDIESKVSRGTDLEGNELYNTTTGREQQTWIALPVTVQYSFTKSRFNPYIAAGISTDYCLRSDITIETIQDNAGAVQEKTVDIERNKINLSALVAAGGKLRIFGGYFTGEIRYQYGLLNVNSEEKAYDNSDVVFSNNLGDSVFKLNSFSVTVGYVQNIFNPKKLTRRK
ncbi:MAG TPA: porin family protein [Ohtaekwangia sp.]